MNNNYAFIDIQNLNLSIRRQGWKLDLKKFRVYLNDKFKVTKAFIFIGYIKVNQDLYDFLLDSGYILIFKPVISDRNNKIKGNVDAELVLYASAIEYSNYDKAVIVSGDGDFHCLLEFLESRNKLECICIPNHNAYSRLLRQFRKNFIYISYLRGRLELKEKE